MELTNLFTTVAQVSFAVTGLMFVGLTLDDKTRDFWFAEANSTYVNVNLLTLVLPGLISLGGLIPQVPFLKIPSWIWMTPLIGLLYLLLASRITYLRKTEKYRGFRNMEKRFGDVTWGLWLNSLSLIGVSLSMVYLYANEATSCVLLNVTIPSFVITQQSTGNQPCIQLFEAMTGFLLVMLVISNTFPVFRVVRSYSEIKQEQGNSFNQPLPNKTDKTSTIERTNYDVEQRRIGFQDGLIVSFLAIATVILGMIFSRKPNR